MRHLAILSSLLLLAFAAGSATAEVYKWTDAQGKVHFGDKPPASEKQPVEKIDAKGAYAPGTDAQVKEVYQRTNRMFDAKDKMKKDEQARQAQQTAQHRERLKDACLDAREAERAMNGPVVFTDDEGREIKTSEVERKQKLQETRQWIAANCN